MQVRFFAYLRDFTGCKSVDCAPQPDLKSLVAALCDSFVKLRGRMLNADGTDLHEEIIIMVNGRRVEHLAGLNTKLSPDDVVQIFPVVAGG